MPIQPARPKDFQSPRGRRSPRPRRDARGKVEHLKAPAIEVVFLDQLVDKPPIVAKHGGQMREDVEQELVRVAAITIERIIGAPHRGEQPALRAQRETMSFEQLEAERRIDAVHMARSALHEQARQYSQPRIIGQMRRQLAEFEHVGPGRQFRQPRRIARFGRQAQLPIAPQFGQGPHLVQHHQVRPAAFHPRQQKDMRPIRSPPRGGLQVNLGRGLGGRRFATDPRAAVGRRQ